MYINIDFCHLKGSELSLKEIVRCKFKQLQSRRIFFFVYLNVNIILYFSVIEKKVSCFHFTKSLKKVVFYINVHLHIKLWKFLDLYRKMLDKHTEKQFLLEELLQPPLNVDFWNSRCTLRNCYCLFFNWHLNLKLQQRKHIPSK